MVHHHLPVGPQAVGAARAAVVSTSRENSPACSADLVRVGAEVVGGVLVPEGMEREEAADTAVAVVDTAVEKVCVENHCKIRC